MSKIKNWIEEQRITEIERRFESEDFDLIYLFANIEARAANSNSNHYFQVYGHFFEELFGGGEIEGSLAIVDVETKSCDCFSCDTLGHGIDELISIRAGLRWCVERYGKTPIDLWVSSEQFIEEIQNGFPDFSVDCEFQQQLVEDIVELSNKVPVQVHEYTYVNRDLIPFFVEGKSLTETVEVLNESI